MRVALRVMWDMVFAFGCTGAVAADPPPYRAVLFEDAIGESADSTGLVLNLSRWPSTHRGGDGLRFRFASDTVVVGTVSQDGSNPVLLRAARWKLGDPASRVWLQVPQGVVGSFAADANRDGMVVGAVIVSTPTSASASIQAASWTFSSGELSGEPHFQFAFGPDDFAECGGVLPHTMLSAVGQRSAPPGNSAMVAGTGCLVREGEWPDGFLGELTAGGQLPVVERFPGVGDPGWCDTWTAHEVTRSSFGQCIGWEGEGLPSAWTDCSTIGSAHEVDVDKQVHCFHSHRRSLFRWTKTTQSQLIENCDGCSDGGTPTPCAQSSPDGIEFSFVTDLRLGAFAPKDVGVGTPQALAGIIGVRFVTPDDDCFNQTCAIAHAAVVIPSGEAAWTGLGLFDLHTVLPDGTSSAPFDFEASGIARIYARSTEEGSSQTSRGWIAVGAVGDNFEPGGPDDGQHGCLWVGRLDDAGETQWCAHDANDLAIRPDGLTIEALHDLNECGLAVGVASDMHEGNIRKRLVYLTEAADLNGDLQTDGTDLSQFMDSYSDCSGASLADLDQDGCVGGSDLALLLGGWGGNGPGCPVGVSLTCAEPAWRSPLQRFPYIIMAAEALGFESMDSFADSLDSLSPGARAGLCEIVDVLASQLEGGQ